jgi:hypothetical protein
MLIDFALRKSAINSDNAGHSPASVIRQGQYLKHVVEQASRAVKRVTRPMLGFKAWEAAQAPLAGIALLPRIKKRPCVSAARDASLTATAQGYALCRLLPSIKQGQWRSSNHACKRATEPSERRDIARSGLIHERHGIADVNGPARMT